MPAPEPQSAAVHRVGWGFISLYTLAYMGHDPAAARARPGHPGPEVNSLLASERAPNSLAVVAAIGSLVGMLGNPFFGTLSDRTSSPLGMRRPWMVIGLTGGSLGILVVALAPTIR